MAYFGVDRLFYRIVLDEFDMESQQEIVKVAVFYEICKGFIIFILPSLDAQIDENDAGEWVSLGEWKRKTG
jgi:hypothetical protein